MSIPRVHIHTTPAGCPSSLLTKAHADLPAQSYNRSQLPDPHITPCSKTMLMKTRKSEHQLWFTFIPFHSSGLAAINTSLASSARSDASLLRFGVTLVNIMKDVALYTCREYHFCSARQKCVVALFCYMVNMVLLNCRRNMFVWHY